jgi:hypothetical protein
MRHYRVDSGIRCLQPIFVIFAQTTVVIEPTKGAFHDPPSGLDFKTLLVIGAQDDFNVNPKLHCTVNEATAISRISPNFAKARIDLRQPIEQPTGHRAILITGFGDEGFEDQPLRVDDQVAFASFDLFACVVAATAPFSVVFTDWLSMIAALGVASRPSS